ncbi:Ca2+ transporter [Plectosphaerella cucumerina]|uniref:Vacuolar calcium ion transporter n=1 Tax=Plectosphaerella cucumerina TaxID=40658 RepID=A0A8K0X972_9PEZI|nr:Ca2+ transporter [Plectosphaerella cucumerina]
MTDHDDHARLHAGKLHRLVRWFRSTVSSSWVNGLLVFVPIGLVSYMLHFNPFLTFILNGIAIIPLSALLTDATEKISSDAGDTVGALLNISLGNLVELIILVALINNQIRIVLASILGSILVNLLLILGSALLASSMSDSEPTYNTAETQLLSSLLFVSVFVFLMPTAFDYTYDHSGADGAILQMTRMSAIMVLLIYILYFVHELRGGPAARHSPPAELFDVERYQLGQTEPYEGGRSRGDRAFSIMILIGTSIVMSMCAEFLVSTIDYVTHQGHLSEALIGLIILPIVGNIAEYVTVVTVAAKDKLDLAIAVAVGSAIQIALCVTPLTILAAWLLDRKLALTFNVFEMTTLLGTVLMVNLLILSDGSKALRANGLKGALMCACYVIIS